MKNLREIIKILEKHGFQEEVPTKDYESGKSFWWFKKYPFIIRIGYQEIMSSRLDKEYIYNSFGKLIIKK